MQAKTQPKRIKITSANIVAITPSTSKDCIYWDTKLSGFGVKVTPAGGKSFIYQYRPKGGGNIRRYTIGKAGEHGMAANEARRQAEQLRSDVANSRDPQLEKSTAKKRKTLGELCQWFLDKDCPQQIKAGQLTDSTVQSSYKPRLRYVLEDPLASRKAETVKSSDIEGLKSRLLNRKKQTRRKDGDREKSKVGQDTLSIDSVNTCLRALHRVYERARIVGLLSCENPSHGMKQFTSTAVENYLEDDEIARLARVLSEQEPDSPVGINVIRMALLTGARRNEINRLKWSEVNLPGRLILREEHKNKRRDNGKPREIVITDAVAGILEKAKGWKLEGNPYVFPAQYHRSASFKYKKIPSVETATGPYGGLTRLWRKVRKLAGVEDKRFHDLRHSVGALAMSGGLSLQETGKLLGHRNAAATERYAHVNRSGHKRAAEAVSAVFNAILDDDAASGDVVNFEGKS